MRVLTYGLSTDKLAGIETFLLNMNEFMPDDVIFDYVIEGQSGISLEQQTTIHQAAVDERGGKVFYIAPKRNALSNLADWWKVLRQQRASTDVAYFNLYSLAWFFPVVMARLMKYKVFVHAHNNNLHDCGALQRSLHAAFRFLQKYLKINRLTNSKLSETFFFGNVKSELIYNAIDTQRFAYCEEKRTALREMLHMEGKNVYGFAGRIMYQKNPVFLMEVFNQIRYLDKNAAFLVCGEGDLMDEVQAKANELELAVHFAGSCANVQDYYSAMDAFILPSRFEGLGLVLIEAQCCGLPSVTSADVVPQEAKVTELLDYISLEKPVEEWARLCVAKLEEAPGDRKKYSEVVAASNYEIRNEAVRLAGILRR